MATAINERTGKAEQVRMDAYGRVPAGYRAMTREDRAYSRSDQLMLERRRARARGDVVAMDQIERTMADARATGVAF